MESLDNISFKLTTDVLDFLVCARMMADSDPWITLGMDYMMCLSAFEGPSKEVYVIEKENEIAGFVSFPCFNN